MQIAVYYFPNYHVDARNELVHGTGWTEWELVKSAKPCFSGHQQPRVPALGYLDEANPSVFAHKIEMAAAHAIDCFIFDWYYYNDGPYLQRGLEQGYLCAPQNERVKFALMWANHDWVDIHPAQHDVTPRLLYPGMVTRETWDRMTDYIIERYFHHPSYWMVDGCPYFSIYELYRLIDGLGGLDATQSAIASFRAKTKAAGFPDLHLNGVVWGVSVLPRETSLKNSADIVDVLGLDSVASYVWIHHVPLSDFPLTSYDQVRQAAIRNWDELTHQFRKPYYPNVTMGWDSSPRTRQDGPYGDYGYPYMASLSGNSPEAFKKALLDAREYMKTRPANQQIISINAWNEWTEGSYLEPDTVNGMGYLEAIREVFGTA